MIRTTRNPMLGSASFWTQDLSIIGFKTKTLSELVSDMFKNGEQGFFYDPSSLTYGTYGVDQTSVGVPVTVGVADAAEYDGTSHIGSVYRADQYNQSIVNFDVDNTKSHELVIENTGATTIAVNADLAMGTVLFTVAAGQRVTRLIAPVQVIVITSANNVSTAIFKIHSLREISGGVYTMYQDAAGTIPVTAAGQPVGLMLDKSKGSVLGSENVINGSLTTLTSWETPVTAPASVTLVAGGVRVYSPAGEAATLRQQLVLKRGGWYKVQFNVKSITGSGYIALYTGTAGLQRYDFSTSGVKTIYLQAAPTGDYLSISRSTACDFVISDVSVKEVTGNHAYQSTSSMRPLLQDSPRRIDYDGVDDKLITNLPSQLTGCTVIRAVPNVATQILTNQTIPTPYNDSTDHCGLIVINRALTSTETAQITRLFNKAAGV